jgi:hypothetical protein
VIADLSAKGIEREWGPAADGWYDEREGPSGTGFFLRQLDGRCVFLRPDERCAVHALHGAAAKPGFCREFPYHLVSDPRGTAAVIRATCAGFHRSFRDGDAIAPADVDAAAALPRVVPRAAFAPERVAVLPGVDVDLESWMDAEEELLEGLVDQDLDPRELVAAVRETLAARAGVALDPTRPAQLDAAVDAIVRALGHVLSAVLASPEGAPHKVRFAREVAGALARARSRPAQPLDPDARAFANLLLRSFLLSKQWAAWGSVAEGIGLWGLEMEFARRVALVGPSGVTAATLAAPIEQWERFASIGLVAHWLRKARVALLDVFLHSGG